MNVGSGLQTPTRGMRIDMTAGLKVEDCVNDKCPWSGKPVSADSLTLYKGNVVGFCNPGCRDKFEMAVNMFEGMIELQEIAEEREAGGCPMHGDASNQDR